MKDYDYDIRYHPCKANMVADTLIRKVVLSQISTYRELQQDLVKE